MSVKMNIRKRYSRHSAHQKKSIRIQYYRKSKMFVKNSQIWQPYQSSARQRQTNGLSIQVLSILGSDLQMANIIKSRFRLISQQVQSAKSISDELHWLSSVILPMDIIQNTRSLPQVVHHGSLWVQFSQQKIHSSKWWRTNKRSSQL